MTNKNKINGYKYLVTVQLLSRTYSNLYHYKIHSYIKQIGSVCFAQTNLVFYFSKEICKIYKKRIYNRGLSLVLLFVFLYLFIIV